MLYNNDYSLWQYGLQLLNVQFRAMVLDLVSVGVGSNGDLALGEALERTGIGGDRVRNKLGKVSLDSIPDPRAVPWY